MALLTAHLSEASGGFAWAVPGMALALSRLAGTDTHVVGVSDRRSPDAWQRWADQVHPHREFGPRAFGWAPAMARTLANLAPDVVDAQGLWMYPSLANLRRHRRSRGLHVITPHGMLDPWTLRRSAWKKRLVARWFENEHLRRAACLRALNMNEAKGFRAYGLSNPIAVVPNGVDLPDHLAAPPEDSRTLLFLGRIDPKKGIAELLRAWALLQGRAAAANWRLQITGWGDPAYVAAMQRLALDLSIDGQVEFTGPLFEEAKAEVVRNATGFVLPSFSEGLPMAVLEAWSHGLPVLMTRECNLPEGFASGAALEATTEPRQLARQLHAVISMSAVERRAMGQAGRRLVEERFTWDRVAAEMRTVYDWVLGGGSAPSCIITG